MKQWYFCVPGIVRSPLKRKSKGPSDGVGGTVKREARRESLQRPLDNQITTPQLQKDI